MEISNSRMSPAALGKFLSSINQSFLYKQNVLEPAGQIQLDFISQVTSCYPTSTHASRKPLYVGIQQLASSFFTCHIIPRRSHEWLASTHKVCMTLVKFGYKNDR